MKATIEQIGHGTYLVWGKRRMYLSGDADGVTAATIEAIAEAIKKVGATDDEAMLVATIDEKVDATKGAEAVYIDWETFKS